MAAIRSQREIRQRAPWWLIVLLALNFGLMTYDARDVATKQRKIRTMAQTVADPFERAGSGLGNWIGGFFCRFRRLPRASPGEQPTPAPGTPKPSEAPGAASRTARG